MYTVMFQFNTFINFSTHMPEFSNRHYQLVVLAISKKSLLFVTSSLTLLLYPL